MEAKYRVALIILYDPGRRLLLQHRTKDAKILPDYWAFFGGSVRQGETPHEAVRREALEELNYKLKAPQLFIEQDFKIGSTEGYMYVYIEAFDSDKSLLNLQEGQGWGWYKASEVDGLRMIDHDRKLVKSITRYLENSTNTNSERAES
ncbi:MAG: NUDIX domain-containing protein [Candidatus Brocadiales bacterium]